MADPIGEYNFKNTGIVLSKTADGQIQQIVSYEGTATDSGSVFGSLISTMPLAEAGAKSGPCSWVARAILDDGTLLGGLGEGTWERIGNELRVNVSLVHEVSDGQERRTEGVVDQKEHTFNGQMCAIE